MKDMIGRVLGNRYEIVEKIGEGGMAFVYRARCHLLNRFVAVKVLREELANDAQFVSKFDQESQAAASLSHPNIVNIYDVGKDGDIRYIVMELIKGLTLKNYIYQHEGFIPNDEIIEISKRVALGIEHAHTNRIIHRDIKPHNILINDEAIVKVADFGIARAVTSSTINASSDLLGSVHYSSPEQSRGGFVDERTDIYSLGILMYELATKTLPFEGEQPVSIAMQHIKDNVPKASSVNPNIKAGFESVIIKAMQKEPADRYSTIGELIADLDKLSQNPNLDLPFYVIEPVTGKIVPNLDGLVVDLSEKKEKAGFSIFKMTLVIIAALLLSAVVVGAVFMNSVLDRMRPKIVTMPNIVGMEYVTAANQLQELGLKINVRDHMFDSNIPKDYIIRQFSEENTTLKEGFTVEVIVSNGPEMVKIPNLIQKELSEARVILENKELDVGDIKYEYNDLPSGMIVEQSPVAGSDVVKATQVHLVVSQGTPIETVIMPNLVGKSLSNAKDALTKSNLFLGDIDYNESDKYPKDTVILQNVKAGREIREKSTVNLVISKGSPEVVVPPEGEDANISNPDGSQDQQQTNPEDGSANTSENGQEQNDAAQNLELIEKSYIIPLNFATQTEVVKLEKIQDGVRTMVYEKEHNKDEKNVRIVVRGKGKAIINIYFGDVQIKSMEADFN